MLMCAFVVTMAGARLIPLPDRGPPNVINHPDDFVLGTGYYRAMATFPIYGDPSRLNEKVGTMDQDEFFEAIDNKVDEATGENFLKLKYGEKWVPTHDGDFDLVAQVTKEKFDTEKPLTAAGEPETTSSGDGHGPQVVLQKTAIQERPPRACKEECTYPSICFGGACSYRPYRYHQEAKYKCVGNKGMANPQLKKAESKACEEFEGDEDKCLGLDVDGRKPCAWEKDSLEWFIASRGGKNIVRKDRHMRWIRRRLKADAERAKKRKDNKEAQAAAPTSASFLSRGKK